jgi:L-lactate dehydrogenase complex protein LldF
MLTDECEMRPFLENRGIEIVETDLGERIQQLDDEPPSHIVVPAVHKLRGDVAEVFGRTLGTDPRRTPTCRTWPRASAATPGRTT